MLVSKGFFFRVVKTRDRIVVFLGVVKRWACFYSGRISGWKISVKSLFHQLVVNMGEIFAVKGKGLRK